jgi:hypothetical protein
MLPSRSFLRTSGHEPTAYRPGGKQLLSRRDLSLDGTEENLQVLSEAFELCELIFQKLLFSNGAGLRHGAFARCQRLANQPKLLSRYTDGGVHVGSDLGDRSDASTEQRVSLRCLDLLAEHD